ncbi:hypothetical protein BH23BAC1_BH23BAC1_32870 [soil metagenome]
MLDEKDIIRIVGKFTFSVWILIFCVLGSSFLQLGFYTGILDYLKGKKDLNISKVREETALDDIWKAPDINSVPLTPEGDLIRYGRDLVAHTSLYLGPKGKLGTISNGMNCQNCHLEAGTKPFGNNYGAVASKYPLFRDRSGTIETIEKRVNDCIERSLNGEKLDQGSPEMNAFVAYLKWVGKRCP